MSRVLHRRNVNPFDRARGIEEPISADELAMRRRAADALLVYDFALGRSLGLSPAMVAVGKRYTEKALSA